MELTLAAQMSIYLQIVLATGKQIFLTCNQSGIS